MAGIYIAAILTIAFSLVFVGFVLFKRIQSSDQLFAVLGILGSAAAFFGAYYLLRLPLDKAFQSLMQTNPAWYRFWATFYAPLTEEPARWLILVPLFWAGKITSENKGAWALCLGFGFGMSEIVFLAQRIALDPHTLVMPWYLSSGFIVERLMVCFIHSALVLIAADALCNHKPWGMLLAPVFHWLFNFPIYLSILFPFDAKGIVWGQILWMWNGLFLLAALIYLRRQFLIPEKVMAALLGRVICPECQTCYVRPLWGMNRIGKRYERCPQCKHHHWTTLYVEPPKQ